MKKLFAGIIALVCLLTVAACGSAEKRRQLAREIEGAQSSLPLSLPFGTIDEISYDEDANEVTYGMEMDELVDLDTSIWEATADGMAEKMKLVVASEQFAPLARMLVDADARLKLAINVTCDGRRLHHEETVPVDDIREGLRNPLTAYEVRTASMKIDFDNMRRALPADVGDGVTWVDVVYREGDSLIEFVYDMEFSEENGMDVLDDGTFKVACLMLFTDPGVCIALQNAAAYDLDVRYTVRDAGSSRSLSADFTPDEIRRNISADYSEEEAAFLIFKAGVELGARDCPMTLDDGCIVRNMEISGKDYIITVELPEPEFDVTILSKNPARTHQKISLIEALREDPETVESLREFIDRVIYRYVGTPSGKVVDIEILPSEL